MKWLLNLVGKFSGFDALWKKMDGFKTKAAGMVSFLTGLAGVIAEAIKISDFATALAFIKGLPMDGNWLTMLAGLAILGIGHKLEKVEPKQP